GEVLPSPPAGEKPKSRNHARPVAAGMAAASCNLVGCGDQIGKRFLRVYAVPGCVRLVVLHVNAQRRPACPRTGQAENDARASAEHDTYALMLADRTIDRVVIGEVVRLLDCQAPQ